MKKHKLEEMVRTIMTEQSDTRNDDILLTERIWLRYYSEYLIVMENGKMAVPLHNLTRLPREDNVKRVRAHIQNDLHELVPTNLTIAKKRGWAEREWRSYLGYTAPAIAQAKHIESKIDKPRQDELFKTDVVWR